MWYPEQKSAQRYVVLVVVGLLWQNPVGACENKEQLKALDIRYEQAILNADTVWLEQYLDEDFVWVHSLDSARESRTALIHRLSSAKYNKPAARLPRHDILLRKGNTWVAIGHSKVQKTLMEEGVQLKRTNTYLFTRTYVLHKHRCVLLSSSTAKIAVEDLPLGD